MAHAWLAAALRADIGAGRLRPGDRLPPSRVLAEELALSRWVVTEAYAQLMAEGYLTARVGSGTLVAAPGGDRSAPAAVPAPDAAAPHRRPRETTAGRRAAPTADDARPGERPVDLSPALPDLASFPRAAWRAASARALALADGAALGRPDPRGAVRLRVALAEYLGRARSLTAPADAVLITQGVGNAVWLLCHALRAAGARRVAVEDPSWPRLHRIATAHGLEVVTIGVDREGLRVEDLFAADAHRPVQALFTMPTHHFPTGVPLSAPRRRALLAWAQSRRRWIVEDDYDAEFRYDRRPVGALAALDAEHVIYLGSVSKTLSPGLHLGWAVAPPALADALARARDGLGALAPVTEQLALADLLTTGAFERHLRRMRRQYGRRRRAVLESLTRATPGRAAPGMDAGLHVLWLLPDPTDGPAGREAEEQRVLRACREQGLTLLGLADCSARPAGSRPAGGLVIGCANLPEARAGEVAAAITRAITG